MPSLYIRSLMASLVILFSFGCSTLKYVGPEGGVFTYTRVLSDARVGKLKVTKTTLEDGSTETVVEIEDMTVEQKLAETLNALSKFIPVPK